MDLYRRALACFRPDTARIAFLFVMLILAVAIDVLLPWPGAVLIDTILSDHPQTDFARQVFLAPFPDNKTAQIVGVALIGLLLVIAREGIMLIRIMLNNRLRLDGTARVRNDLYAKLQDLGPAYHKAAPQGDAIYRLSTDAWGFFGILDTVIATSFACATIVAYTAIMFARSLPLALCAVSIVPLLIGINLYFAGTIRRRAAASKAIDTDLTTAMQRSLASMSLIHAFSQQARALAGFRSAVNHSNRAAYSLCWQEALYPFALQAAFALSGALVFAVGGYFIYRDQFLTHTAHPLVWGELTAFLFYMARFNDPLGRITGFKAAIQTNATSVARVCRVLDLPPLVADPADAAPLAPKPRTLSLSHVTFAYPPLSALVPQCLSASPLTTASPPVLHNLTLHITPGQMVAFVGPSGAGKSTLLNLLPRFFDPAAGSIRLDGHDLRTIALADVRRHIAVVSQDCLLLPTSIAQNIAYGSPTATLEQVVVAAKAAGAHEFIAPLPDGYDTLVTEGGQNLSGGQRQRIAIARALLTDAPILLLDEPTSALDATQERLVMETLRSLTPDRTVILITHHLTSLQDCDQIFVLESGHLVERGTHETLLASAGLYAQLAHTRAGTRLTTEVPTAA